MALRGGACTVDDSGIVPRRVAVLWGRVRGNDGTDGAARSRRRGERAAGFALFRLLSDPSTPRCGGAGELPKLGHRRAYEVSNLQRGREHSEF